MKAPRSGRSIDEKVSKSQKTVDIDMLHQDAIRCFAPCLLLFVLRGSHPDAALALGGGGIELRSLAMSVFDLVAGYFLRRRLADGLRTSRCTARRRRSDFSSLVRRRQRVARLVGAEYNPVFDIEEIRAL